MTGRHATCICIAFVLSGLFTGCDRLDMYDQPRIEPLEASRFFADGLSARQPVEGTIAQGGLREDEAYFTGRTKGRLVKEIPIAAYRSAYQRSDLRFEKQFDDVDRAELRQVFLERGRDRFEIYCSVCHGRTGNGLGMIVQRGFRRPPDYTLERLKNAPHGHFFDVISNGIGAMSSYANRIDVGDRWAIVAYIRALQLSQSASVDSITNEHRAAINSLSDDGDSRKERTAK